jgi:hypothetical protein
MPYTVSGAFDRFRKDVIDLNPNVTNSARSSRDYLFEQLKRLAQNNVGFPNLLGEYLSFGSFARRAKIQPLDDIDVLILLNGKGTETAQSPNSNFTDWLRIKDSSAPLSKFTNGYGYVNSTKVLNSIKTYLFLVSNYRKAEIKKTMQAVTINLNSYDWVFDVVPSVPVRDYLGQIHYYLIPDGIGNWLRTNPKIDAVNITAVNQKHNKNFLPLIRLLKYWNRRVHKPRLSSYYFETLVIKTFQYSPLIKDFPNAIKYFFDCCPSYLRASCPDPKNLGPALDASVDETTKEKVINAMSKASSFAGYALMYEANLDHKQAIYWWQSIFGSEFPDYGS